VSISTSDIAESVVLTGSQFSEPMRVTGTATVGDTRESELKGRCQLNYAELSIGFGFDGVRP
jgi:hypothetical protein